MEILRLSFIYMPGDTIPSNQTFIKLEKSLREVDQFKKTKVRHLTVTMPENEAALFEIIEKILT